jgi:DNA-binding transcriptional LysR family regulator
LSFQRGQLRHFVTVAEEGQITRAALRLDMAQPALSQSLARLEVTLGVVLLERNRRGISLTAAGRAFLPKARLVLDAEADASRMADSLARLLTGSIVVGFIGPPPTMTFPELFADFGEKHPGVELAFRDLPFPVGSTSTWLGGVDVAIGHSPEADPAVGVATVRLEQRAVVMHRSHPLAERTTLRVADVIEECFVGYHPSVQREWAAFHSLDDYRGGPPSRSPHDTAATSLQMLALMSSEGAITTLPMCDALIAARAVSELVAVPLEDATPIVLSLSWHRNAANPSVEALLESARSLDRGRSAL